MTKAAQAIYENGLFKLVGLVRKAVRTWGAPRHLASHQGRQFTAHRFRNTLKHLAIRQRVGVVNASPLIFLSRASLIHLLKLAAQQIVVPGRVAEELLRRGTEDVAAKAIEREPWLRSSVPARALGCDSSTSDPIG